MMQAAVALGGMMLLLAGALFSLVAIAWIVLVAVRHLPLVGRKGRR